MSWVIPAAAVTGSPIATSFGNDVIGDLTILETQVALFDVGGTITGSAPATTAPNFRVQAGFFQGVTNGSSVFSVSFPSSFSSCVVSVTVTPTIISGGFASSWFAMLGASTLSAFSGTAYDHTGTGIAGQAVGFCWVAVGR